MKLCEEPSCSKQSSFNIEGLTKGRFCLTHRHEGMVNVKNKQCEEFGCSKIPSFNIEGLTKGRFCLSHRHEGMIDVKHKQCEERGCNKRPNFNIEGLTKGRFCSTHHQEGMVDVTHKQCEESGCSKIPNFNSEGLTKGRFCSTHRQEGMVDVKNKKCEESGCSKQPNFNIEGLTNGRFCSTHRQEGMVNVNDKQCEENGCTILATFGLPGHSATRCKTHLLENMTANPRKRCNVSKCKQIAVWGIGKARHCETHKEPGDLNLVERRCISCGLLDILDQNFKCGMCDPNEFNRRNLAKQRRVKIYLDAHEFVCSSYDVRLDSGVCGNERPDMIYEASSGGHAVVLEVDEEQHKGRPEQCECARMVNISQSIGLPTVFLRYNPDSFKTEKKRYDPPHSTRMKHLNEVLKYALDLSPDDLVGYCSVRRLFFDDWKASTVEYGIVLGFAS